jgi:hypothetical protein
VFSGSSHNQEVVCTFQRTLLYYFALVVVLLIASTAMTKPLNASPSCVGSVDTSTLENHSKNSLRTLVDALDVKGEAESSSSAAAAMGFPLHETRSLILRLTVLVGNLCSLVLQTIPLDPAIVATTSFKDGRSTTSSSSSGYVANSEVRKSLAQILSCLLDVSASASINLETSILKKMELNRRKYPVDLCKVC